MAVLKRFVTLLQVATPSRGINGQDERCISCAAVDSPARSCFMGNQGGQAPSVLALPFKSRDNGNRTFGTFCPTSRGRRTRDGGLYTCRRSPKTNRRFAPICSQISCPFPCQCKLGANRIAPRFPRQPRQQV